ncbi:MAG: ATP-binding protein [Elusimicrobiota bacterium]
MIKNLTNFSLALQVNVQPLIKQGSRDDLESLIQNVSKETEVRISIINPEGRVMAESFKSFQEMESHRNRPEVRAALEGKESHIVRYSTTTKEEMLYVAIPLFLEGEVSAALRSSVFLDEMYFVLNQFRKTILLIAMIMLLVSLGISYLIYKKLKIPLNKIVEGFERVEHGDLEARILIQTGESEIKELVDHFNKMTEKIKKFIYDLSIQTDELNSLISTIQSGIVLLDKKGRIILSNDFFQKIFSSSKMKGKYFWEVIRDERLNEQISQLIEGKEEVFTTEIELFKNDYLCNGTYIAKKNELILVLHDITRSKKLAQIKRDLISNLSHELRTPLTSIKGYLETIEMSDEINKVERDRYMQIIKRNTERLINMVNDLLLLSELEDKMGKLEIEKVNLEEMIRNIEKIFELALQEKKLKLNFNFQQNLPEIEADSYKIEQMLINLIDNAIKYTETGNINVSVELIAANKVKIEVADTGIGIKKEDLNRIFERFYVVNKARSRKQGGTGLGLSIVKHIVMMHKGELEVDSELGRGTRLTIMLPVQQP